MVAPGQWWLRQHPVAAAVRTAFATPTVAGASATEAEASIDRSFFRSSAAAQAADATALRRLMGRPLWVKSRHCSRQL